MLNMKKLSAFGLLLVLFYLILLEFGTHLKIFFEWKVRNEVMLIVSYLKIILEAEF